MNNLNKPLLLSLKLNKIDTICPTFETPNKSIRKSFITSKEK